MSVFPEYRLIPLSIRVRRGSQTTPERQQNWSTSDSFMISDTVLKPPNTLQLPAGVRNSHYERTQLTPRVKSNVHPKTSTMSLQDCSYKTTDSLATISSHYCIICMNILLGRCADSFTNVHGYGRVIAALALKRWPNHSAANLSRQ